MREILFRGKRVDNEKWIEGSLVNNIFFRAETNRPVPYIINPDEYEEYCCMEDIGELAVEVLEETVGQCTGLTDKNGVEIFEGDILSDGENIFVVDWDKKFASFVLIMEGWMFKHFFVEAVDAKDVEIIGNIHDNPAKDEIQP